MESNIIYRSGHCSLLTWGTVELEPSRLGSADTKCVGPAGAGEVGIVAGAEAVTVTTSSLADFIVLHY